MHDGAVLMNNIWAVFISKNHPLYRPPSARQPGDAEWATTYPHINCTVGFCQSSLYAVLMFV